MSENNVAKIHEEVLVIKLSKLVKNSQEENSMVNEEILTALEQVTQELVGTDIVVEVEKA